MRPRNDYHAGHAQRTCITYLIHVAYILVKWPTSRTISSGQTTRVDGQTSFQRVAYIHFYLTLFHPLFYHINYYNYKYALTEAESAWQLYYLRAFFSFHKAPTVLFYPVNIYVRAAEYIFTIHYDVNLKAHSTLIFLLLTPKITKSIYDSIKYFFLFFYSICLDVHW